MLMVALCYLPANEVIFPPQDTGCHALNGALCQEFNLHPRVKSLLKRLPYLQSSSFDPVQFLEDSTAICYLDDDELRRRRLSPHYVHELMREEEIGVRGDDKDYALRPQDVALTRMISRDGNT
jgi:hypothetical protein